MFDEMIVSGPILASSLAKSACFTSSRSSTASMTRSWSCNLSRSSSRFPTVTSLARAELKNAAGRDFKAFSRPPAGGQLRFRSCGASGGTMSRRSVGIPALARWAAMPAPITPAPRTATRRIGVVMKRLLLSCLVFESRGRTGLNFRESVYHGCVLIGMRSRLDATGVLFLSACGSDAGQSCTIAGVSNPGERGRGQSPSWQMPTVATDHGLRAADASAAPATRAHRRDRHCQRRRRAAVFADRRRTVSTTPRRRCCWCSSTTTPSRRAGRSISRPGHGWSRRSRSPCWRSRR